MKNAMLSFMICALVALSAGARANAVDADVPETPLLAAVQRAIEHGDVPRALPGPRRLTTEPLPGLDWSKQQVLGFEVRPLAQSPFVSILSNSWAPAYRDVWIPYIVEAGVGHHLAGRLELTGPHLVQCLNRPDALLATTYRQPGGNRGFDCVQIGVLHGKLVLMKSPSIATEADPVVLYADTGGKPRIDVMDSVSQHIVGSIPVPKDEEIESDYDARVVSGGVEAVSLENLCFIDSTDPGGAYRVSWFRVRSGRTQRSATRLLKATEIAELLPASWMIGHARIIPDASAPARILPDGSVLTRAMLTQDAGYDQLWANLLVDVPTAGRLRLFGWEVRHFYTGTDTASEVAASAAHGEYWYSGQGGTVEHGDSSATSVKDDMSFDVDRYHKTIYYLLHGVLWSMEAP